MEKKIIQILQKLNINKIANYISFPFHTYPFNIIVLYLFINKKINLKQFIYILFSQLLIGIVKYKFKRSRPCNEYSNISCNDMMNYDIYSFPSGHTFNALILYFIFPSVSLFTPIIVGISRMILGQHYLTDVIGSFIFALILRKTIMN